MKAGKFFEFLKCDYQLHTIGGVRRIFAVWDEENNVDWLHSL